MAGRILLGAGVFLGLTLNIIGPLAVLMAPPGETTVDEVLASTRAAFADHGAENDNDLLTNKRVQEVVAGFRTKLTTQVSPVPGGRGLEDWRSLNDNMEEVQ